MNEKIPLPLPIAEALDSRLGLNTLLNKPIPAHSNRLAYMLGGLTLAAVVILFLSGFVLAQFYHSHPDAPGSPGAYASLKEITSKPVLAFVRNVHYWTAQVALLLLVLHLMRVFFAGSYKKPREFVWWSGVVLFILMLALAFTGTVLKWDQEAVEALGHFREGAELMGATPSLYLPQLASGVPLLTRLYPVHVALLPVLLLAVLGGHFLLVRLLGISGPRGMGKDGRPVALKEPMAPFWTHFKMLAIYGAGLAVSVVLIAWAFPAPLGGMRGVEDLEITKPPWYMMPIYGIENFLGLPAIPYFVGAIFLGLFLVPLMDRSGVTDPRMRRGVVVAMLLILAVIVGLMVYSAVLPPKVHL